MAEYTRKVLMIALADEDIERIESGETVTVSNGSIAVTSLGNESDDFSRYDFVIGMSDNALGRVKNHKVANYGINHTGKEVEEVLVRHGKISRHIGSDKNAKERVVESGMTPEEAEKYTN